MRASLPFALPLLLALPLLTYVLYPPGDQAQPRGDRSGPAASCAKWAASRCARSSWRCWCSCAILLWVFGGSFIDPTLAALVAHRADAGCGVVTWDDMAKNHAAWTTLVLLATLVTLADGLSRAGFVKWFADFAAAHVGGLLADADPGAAGRDLLRLALHVREPDRAYHSDDADDAGGGDGHTGARRRRRWRWRWR